MHTEWARAQSKKKANEQAPHNPHSSRWPSTNNQLHCPETEYSTQKYTMNTHPTIRRCSKMLHALTDAVETKNEPKHDTQYGCINHLPSNPHNNTTGRACFRWQNTH